jgi:lysylphosphatidylglycerol synthetase-like protein (DUF2156 family)
MTPHIPVEDPSQGGLIDRSVAYVQSNPILRVALIATVIDHIAAIVLVLTRRLAIELAGVLVLFSVLSWFFAVCMPVMQRTIRHELGARQASYLDELVAMFARFFLFLVTFFYTAGLVWAAVGS